MCSAAYFITFLPGFAGGKIRGLAFLTPSIAGLVLWILADRQLMKNYRAGLWTDEELAPIRALLAHQAWGRVGILLFVLGLLTAGFSKHHATLIYLTVMPLNAVTTMKTALTPPRRATGGLIDWKNFKPVHSDHWGEAPHSHNDALLSLAELLPLCLSFPKGICVRCGHTIGAECDGRAEV